MALTMNEKLNEALVIIRELAYLSMNDTERIEFISKWTEDLQNECTDGE